MAKNRQHFVPRFYLSAFSSAPKRINVFVIDKSLAIHDASLKKQGYKHKFYGQTVEDLEDALAEMEGHAAPVLRTIRETETLPEQDSEQYVTLLAFVAFQLQRTTAAADRVNTLADKTTKQAFSRDPRFTRDELESVQIRSSDPAVFALRNVPHILLGIADLKAHLATSSGGAFVTSDNPVFKYNQYCEGIQYQGVTGVVSSGFQIFFPLSPQVCLILYDGDTYNVPRRDRRARCSSVSQQDVEMINGMQLVSAQENVYFADWQRRAEIESVLAGVRGQRRPDRLVVQEYGHETDERRSLLVSFEEMPNLQLQLSFLKIRWRAKSVALADRARRYRTMIPLPPVPEPPAHLRGPATFSRFLGRR